MARSPQIPRIVHRIPDTARLLLQGCRKPLWNVKTKLEIFASARSW